MTTELAVVASPHVWSTEAVAPVDRAGAVERLPGSADQDPYERLAVAFLVGHPRHCARAYLWDLKAWGCGGRTPACTYRATPPRWPADGLELDRSAAVGGVGLLRLRHRRLDVLAFSPGANVRRPKVSDDSTTVGLSVDELVALLDAAEAHSPRWGALVSLLACNGVRIDEALRADVAGYTYQRGHRVLRITRKGGRSSTEPLAPPTVRVLDAYLEPPHPLSGPLFLDRTNTRRLVYTKTLGQIQRLTAKAGIPAAAQITPHSLRHTFLTEALAAGVPLQDVQDAAGHRDPRTTWHYDRSRHNLDRHPTYILAAHLRRKGDHDS